MSVFSSDVGLSVAAATTKQVHTSILKQKKKTIEIKKKQTHAKIVELKKKEHIEITKLSNTQVNLEKTETDIEKCQNNITNIKNKLYKLQTRINSITKEYDHTIYLAGQRLRQIYKGERITILHMIMSTRDISSFFDRLYFQKRLAVYDKNLLSELRDKTHELYAAKSNVEVQKRNYLTAIEEMNSKKRLLADSIETSQDLISKLRSDRSTYEKAENDLESQSASIEQQLRSSMGSVKYKGVVTGGFLKPIAGILTSPYGPRRHPIFGTRSFHRGVDLAAGYGAPVKASNSGVVIFTGWYGGYGKVVIINHGNVKGRSTSTLYAHLSSFSTSAGQKVSKGEVIAREGTTGYSTGPHLHFEVRLDGSTTNPLGFI
ncbi:MAG: peptidoglycan DD-metalloendopeptidase family protein [bacterium]